MLTSVSISNIGVCFYSEEMNNEGHSFQEKEPVSVKEAFMRYLHLCCLDHNYEACGALGVLVSANFFCLTLSSIIESRAFRKHFSICVCITLCVIV